MAKKDDFYITTLKFVRQKTVENGGINDSTEATNYVRDMHPTVDETMIFRAYLSTRESTGDGRDMMTSEAYFRLMAYEDLQQARESSMDAMIVAIGALLISSMIGITSIVVSLNQV